MSAKTASRKESLLSVILHHQLLIPIAALLLLVLFNLIADPSFFRVELGTSSLGYPVLKGNL